MKSDQNMNTTTYKYDRWKVKKRFRDLKKESWADVGFLGSDHKVIFKQINYKKIIELGEAVIPCLLNDMKKSSCHWYWYKALQKITNKDALSEMAKDKTTEEYMELALQYEASIEINFWLDWGRKNGYID